MKKIALIILFVTFSQATYYEIGSGLKVMEFTPKGDNSKLCVAVRLFGDSVSVTCFDKKETIDTKSYKK